MTKSEPGLRRPADEMRLSIVIASYNGADTIAAQLHAIAAQEWGGDLEIVVSDNGSTDETLAVVESYRSVLPQVTVVDASDARGVSHARNVGARVATGDYLLFCDQDDEVGDGWLGAMANALETAPFVAARLDHRTLNPAWSVRSFGEPQSDGLANSVPPFLDYAWGCSLGVHRDLHDRVGGFNSSFTKGGEDNDYCYRIQLSGTPLRFVPSAVVHYRHRKKITAVFRQARGYGRESVKLLTEYASYGMQRPSQWRAVVGWTLILPRTLLDFPTRHGRARWLTRLGWKVGRLEASLLTRTLDL